MLSNKGRSLVMPHQIGSRTPWRDTYVGVCQYNEDEDEDLPPFAKKNAEDFYLRGGKLKKSLKAEDLPLYRKTCQACQFTTI